MMSDNDISYFPFRYLTTHRNEVWYPCRGERTSSPIGLTACSLQKSLCHTCSRCSCERTGQHCWAGIPFPHPSNHHAAATRVRCTLAAAVTCEQEAPYGRGEQLPAEKVFRLSLAISLE